MVAVKPKYIGVIRSEIHNIGTVHLFVPWRFVTRFFGFYIFSSSTLRISNLDFVCLDLFVSISTWFSLMVLQFYPLKIVIMNVARFPHTSAILKSLPHVTVASKPQVWANGHNDFIHSDTELLTVLNVIGSSDTGSITLWDFRFSWLSLRTLLFYSYFLDALLCSLIDTFWTYLRRPCMA
jgi:hypothetical protein